MNSKSNSRSFKPDRRKGSLALPLFLAATGFLVPLLAFAVPVATTQVSKLCEVQAGGGYDIDQSGNVAQPFAQATACNIYAVGTVPYTNEPAGAYAEGYASAGFGPGFPQIGVTSANAQIAAVNAIAGANLMGTVQYYFEIQPINGVPGTPPSLIPVLFGARGDGYSEANTNSLSRSVGVAELYGAPLYTWQARFEFDGNGNFSGGFDDVMPLGLYANYTYSVVMGAVCETWGTSAACSAAVGPSFLGFDQAAFDAIMGADTFALNEYYQFVVSPSAVPIPPAVWLFGSGMFGLIGVARRRVMGIDHE